MLPSSQRKVEAFLSLKKSVKSTVGPGELIPCSSEMQRTLRNPRYFFVSGESVVFVFKAGLKDQGCHGNS